MYLSEVLFLYLMNLLLMHDLYRKRFFCLIFQADILRDEWLHIYIMAYLIDIYHLH